MHRTDEPRFALFEKEGGVDYLTLHLNGEVHTHLVSELGNLPSLKRRVNDLEKDNFALRIELAEFLKEKADKKRGKRAPKIEEVDD